MKKLILFVIYFLFIIGGSVSASETVTYNIDEIGVMIAFQKEYQVYEEKSDNIYMTAFINDDALIELAFDNESTIANGLLSLENLSYSKIETLIKNLKKDAEEMGLEIEDYNHYVFNRLPYVQMLYHNPGTGEKGIQYATIFDSALYTVTLKTYLDKIPTKYEKALLRSMESFYIYKTERIADTTEYWKNKNYVEYSLEEIGIDISIPAEYIVFTRNSPDNNLFFEEYPASKDKIISNFESTDVYFKAMSRDKTHEITLFYTPAKVSDISARTAENIITKDKIEATKNVYTSEGVTAKDIFLFNFSGIPFFNIITENPMSIQNITIYKSNDLLLTITPIHGEMKEEYKTILNNVTRTIKFHNLTESSQNNIESHSKLMIIVATLAPITIIALICWFIIFIHDRKRNKKNEEQ